MELSQTALYYVKVFAITLILMFLMDLVWLRLIAKNLYNTELGNFGGNTGGVISIRWPVAIAIYFIMALGLVLFVLPRIQIGTFSILAFGWGAAFGFIVYGIYNLSNLATLPQWSLKMSLIDMAWGTFLYGIMSLIVGYLARFLK
jgi:uncharacterized membrane protein